VFFELAKSLADILHVDVAFIAYPAAEAGKMDLLAMQVDGGRSTAARTRSPARRAKA
jgi:hypothetical protein